MAYLPNFLSFLRIPLALLLLIQHPVVRVLAVFFAMLTDILDGFFARRMKSVSKLGTLLDPFTDKFFVLFALWVFFSEARLGGYELLAFLCRDLSLLFFSIYLWGTKRWRTYTIRAFLLGKIVTSMQFITLILLSLAWEVPSLFYVVMGFLGVLAFFELFYRVNCDVKKQS